MKKYSHERIEAAKSTAEVRRTASNLIVECGNMEQTIKDLLRAAKAYRLWPLDEQGEAMPETYDDVTDTLITAILNAERTLE